MDAGFIKLYRSLLDWEWYHDNDTTRMFLHLLLKANWKDKEWHGITIKRGQLVTSLQNLSEETGLSKQQTRRVLSNLQKTRETTRQTTHRYTLITIEKYEDYQGSDVEGNTVSNIKTTRKPTLKQHATQQQLKKEELKNKELKSVYGEFANITLTDREYLSLHTDYGNEKELIEFLSAYKKEKDYKTKSDYLTIKRWVVKAVQERNAKVANPFKELLRKEIDEQTRSDRLDDGNKSDFSRLLSGERLGE